MYHHFCDDDTSTIPSVSLGIKFTKLPESFIPRAQCLVHYKILVDKKSKSTSSSTTISYLTSPEPQIISPEVMSSESCIVLLSESFVVGSDVSAFINANNVESEIR